MSHLPWMFSISCPQAEMRTCCWGGAPTTCLRIPPQGWTGRLKGTQFLETLVHGARQVTFGSIKYIHTFFFQCVLASFLQHNDFDVYLCCYIQHQLILKSRKYSVKQVYPKCLFTYLLMSIEIVSSWGLLQISLNEYSYISLCRHIFSITCG